MISNIISKVSEFIMNLSNADEFEPAVYGPMVDNPEPDNIIEPVNNFFNIPQLLLLIFVPLIFVIGLLLMWFKMNKLSKTSKIIITIITIIVLIILIFLIGYYL